MKAVERQTALYRAYRDDLQMWEASHRALHAQAVSAVARRDVEECTRLAPALAASEGAYKALKERLQQLTAPQN